MHVLDTYFSDCFPFKFLTFPHSLALQYLYLTFLASIIQFSFAELIFQFHYLLIAALLLIMFKPGYLIL